MRTTEHSVRTKSPRTGPVAAHRASCPASTGIGAPSALRALLATAALMAALFLVLPASPASAAVGGHRFSAYLPSAGYQNYGLAVDEETGDYYSSDNPAANVAKFTSSGQYLFEIGPEVNETVGGGGTEAERNVCPRPAHPADSCRAGNEGNPPFAVAVDNYPGANHGDIYLAFNYSAIIQRYNSEGVLQGTITGSDTPSGSLSAGMALAVDGAGNLWVGNENHLIDEFDSNGAYVSGSQWSSPSSIVSNGLAVNSAGSQIYLANPGFNGVVKSFNSSGTGASAPIASSGAGAYWAGIALSPEGLYAIKNPATDGVEHYSTPCAPSPAHECAPVDTFGAGKLSSPSIPVVDHASGFIYVNNGGEGNIAAFEPIFAPNAAIEPLSNELPTSVTLNGEVEEEARGGGEAEECEFEYGTDNTYSLGTLPCLNAADEEVGTPTHKIGAATAVHADLSGLTPLTEYHYRLLAKGSEATEYSPDQAFTPEPLAPAVDETSSTEVTDTAAKLSGLVNPEYAPTTYKFEYGPSEAYGHSTSPESNLGFSDEADHPAGPTAISGLAPGTEYHFRLVAKNFVGTTHGPDQTFITQGPPGIDAATSSAVTQTAATLAAQINPDGAPTTYHFEYGTSETYGQSTSESSSIGADHAAHPAAAGISGLAPGTTYHFRVVATNKYRTENGPDQTFATEKAPPVIVPSNQFTASLTAKATRATLKLTLPGPGAVSISGKNLKAANANPAAAGTVTLTLRLTAAGAKALKQHHKLKLKLTITFQPTGGIPNTIVKTVTLFAKPKHKEH